MVTKLQGFTSGDQRELGPTDTYGLDGSNIKKLWPRSSSKWEFEAEAEAILNELSKLNFWVQLERAIVASFVFLFAMLTYQSLLQVARNKRPLMIINQEAISTQPGMSPVGEETRNMCPRAQARQYASQCRLGGTRPGHLSLGRRVC